MAEYIYLVQMDVPDYLEADFNRIYELNTYPTCSGFQESGAVSAIARSPQHPGLLGRSRRGRLQDQDQALHRQPLPHYLQMHQQAGAPTAEGAVRARRPGLSRIARRQQLLPVNLEPSLKPHNVDIHLPSGPARGRGKLGALAASPVLQKTY